MATVTIGGKEYNVPELNFVALEKVWPSVEESLLLQHPMRLAAAAIRVIAAGIVYDETFVDIRGKFPIPEGNTLDEDEIFEFVNAYLKRQLKSSEISNVTKCLTDITKEAGITKEGEESPPTEEENLSLETALQSSQNLSPQDAKAEAGKVSEEDGV